MGAGFPNEKFPSRHVGTDYRDPENQKHRADEIRIYLTKVLGAESGSGSVASKLTSLGFKQGHAQAGADPGASIVPKEASPSFTPPAQVPQAVDNNTNDVDAEPLLASKSKSKPDTVGCAGKCSIM